MTQMLRSEEEEMRTTGWHFDKRIAVDNVFTIVTLVITVAWLTSKIDSRVEVLERDIQKNGPLIESLVQNHPNTQFRLQILEDRQIQSLAVLERITKLETQVDNLQELMKVQSSVLTRVEQKLSNGNGKERP